MPAGVRKNDKARQIALDLLGPPPCGLTDKNGNKKRYVKKKDKDVGNNSFGGSNSFGGNQDRFQEIGYR